MSISMTDIDVNYHDIKNDVIGAGILPFTYDMNMQLHLLLGKERYVNHWRGSLKWSGFEGGRKIGESVEQTAAREFVEESMGVVTLPFENSEDDDASCDRIDMIAKALEQGKYYVLRMILCIVQHEASPRRYHVTYVIRVPFGHYENAFASRRLAFAELNAKAEQLKRGVEHLSNLLPRENLHFRGHRIKAVTRVEQTQRILRIEFINEFDQVCMFDAQDICAESCAAYCHWFQLRMLCLSELEKLQCVMPPSAFHEIVTDCFGTVVSLRLNEDFIEKQAIEWWSMEKLRDVLSNGGSSQNEYFRAYFLPVLQRVLEELRRLPT